MHKFALTSVTALVAACGGSTPQPAPPVPEPTPQTDDQARVEAPPPDLLEEPRPANEPDPTVPEESVAIAPESTDAEPPAPVEITASAELTHVKTGAPIGMIQFARATDGMITITGQFSGLKKKANHALIVHEYGDCSQNGTRVGKHLDPTGAKHGPPSSSERHAGDFGNVMADAVGNGTFVISTDSITLEVGRADSVVGRAVVIHTKPDDKKGKDSPALACGVIELD